MLSCLAVLGGVPERRKGRVSVRKRLLRRARASRLRALLWGPGPAQGHRVGSLGLGQGLLWEPHVVRRAPGHSPRSRPIGPFRDTIEKFHIPSCLYSDLQSSL